jgi:uncharacterized membrane protein
MAIGPVQLIVLGFSHPEFHGEIIAELEKLRESDTVRVIDALAVHKDAEGEIEVAHLSNLTKEEAIELGSKVGALVGLGIEGEEGFEAGAAAGAEAAEQAGAVEAFSDEQAWDVIEEIPNDSAAQVDARLARPRVEARPDRVARVEREVPVGAVDRQSRSEGSRARPSHTLRRCGDTRYVDSTTLSVIFTGTVGILGAGVAGLSQFVTVRNEDRNRVEARRDDLRGVCDEAAKAAIRLRGPN